MSRWAPDARGRLAQAALELYGEHGYDATTVAEIAARAGLSERTFFRHFTDKREVLFFGAAALQSFLVGEVDQAASSAAPIEIIMGAFESAATRLFDSAQDYALQRQVIIAASTELQERELVKLATLAASLADALRRRGVGEPAASLAAEAGTTVFRVGLDAWAGGDGTLSLAEHLRTSAEQLRAVTAERSQPTRRRG